MNKNGDPCWADNKKQEEVVKEINVNKIGNGME